MQLDSPTSGVSEKCLLCGIEIPLEQLGRHIETCIFINSSHNDDKDFETEPTWQSVSTSSDTSTIPVAVASLATLY